MNLKLPFLTLFSTIFLSTLSAETNTTIQNVTPVEVNATTQNVIPIEVNATNVEVNATIIEEDANLSERYAQVPLEEVVLTKQTRDNQSFIDTIAVKGGIARSQVEIIKDNGGVAAVNDPSTVGSALSGTIVFNTDLVPFFKPYVDIAVLMYDDRRFVLPGLGLRHDFVLDDKTIEPYFSVGVGYNYMSWKTEPVDLPGLQDSRTGGQSYAFDLQGGVDFYFTDNLALDVSLRYDAYDIGTTIASSPQITTLQENSSLSLLFGIVYRFGDTINDGDDDLDGVKNSKDYCPNTVSGSGVDQFGCALDDDNDKIINMFDKCPETIDGAPVDIDGCALDSDNDLVIDLYDRCPGTLKNIPVTQCGCPPYKFDFTLNFEFAKFKIENLRNNPTFDVVAFLQKNENYHVAITGYTDSVGSKRFNKKLSEKRSNEAMKYLTDHDIDEKRIRILGRGKTEGIAKNDSAENRELNRRIVVTLYRTDKRLVKHRPTVAPVQAKETK